MLDQAYPSNPCRRRGKWLTMMVVVRGFVLGMNTTSLNNKFNIIFVVRNWYETDTSKLVANDLAPRQNYKFILQG